MDPQAQAISDLKATTSSIEARIEGIEDHVQRVSKVMWGNGTPQNAVLIRIDRVESCIVSIKKMLGWLLALVTSISLLYVGHLIRSSF